MRGPAPKSISDACAPPTKELSEQWIEEGQLQPDLFTAEWLPNRVASVARAASDLPSLVNDSFREQVLTPDEQEDRPVSPGGDESAGSYSHGLVASGELENAVEPRDSVGAGDPGNRLCFQGG